MTYKCTICGKVYASMSSLCNHSRNIHKITPTLKKTKLYPIKEEPQFKCDFCDSEYKHRQSKTKHMRTCIYKKNYVPLDSLPQKINDLEDKYEELENKYEEIKNNYEETKHKYDEMQNKYCVLENIINKLQKCVLIESHNIHTSSENTSEPNNDIPILSQNQKDENICDINRNKKHVPKLLKNQSWDVYIGREKGVGNCFCCNSEIDSKHFECGHVIPISKGGPDTIENLRPICSLCNRSMGSKNMGDFMKKYLNKSLNKTPNVIDI